MSMKSEGGKRQRSLGASLINSKHSYSETNNPVAAEPAGYARAAELATWGVGPDLK